MSKTVNYHLFSISTGTVAAAAQATILRAGRIVGIRPTMVGTGGAGGGFVNSTLEFNNTAQANGDTNNPSREVILASAQLGFPSGGVTTNPGVYVPLSVTVQPGDILVSSQVQTGTAPATFRAGWDVYVLES